MKKTRMTRRRFMTTTAAASATMVATPFVRTANAAGKLSIGFWDHWVPGANDATESPGARNGPTRRRSTSRSTSSRRRATSSC